MLLELKITDFATIELLHLSFNANFNVLTGETGAGKSIILDAMVMLLGGRADNNFIRAGSKRASIEGVFTLSDDLQTLLNPWLEEEGLDDEDAPDRLILERELRATGRNFCRVNGRAVNVSLLNRVARPLIDIHGQNEHLSLMRVPHHQRLLDSYAGLDKSRQGVAKLVKKLTHTRRELNNLLQNERDMARQLDQLSYQAEEIESADLKSGEDKSLEIERTRLSNAEQLSQLSSDVYGLLVEGQNEGFQSVTDLLGQASRAFGQLLKLDPSLESHAEALDGLIDQAGELGDQLRNYSEEVEAQPDRLQDVEDRLHLIFNLKRKYGDSIEEILTYGAQAQAKIETISHSEERIAELRQIEEALREQIGQKAQKLSHARQKAGKKMGQGIVRQLADLGMPHTQFSVDVAWQSASDGVYVTDGADVSNNNEGQRRTVKFDEKGIDRIEFLISPNPGEPLKPLVKVASGGETSRVMLALKTVLASADETPTLIFDEIDQGIGGRVGGVVGRKLWELSSNGRHQVLCVTHLPQIAGYADEHYHVNKQVVKQRTKTAVRTLVYEEKVDELAQMLGALSDNTRASAREILTDAQQVKGN
ncbi:DNA repair protein RecN [Anaerolineales bacterium HSG25]|nr:DNA repair protein RecN [Anaerolineales bacterium HSG25]